MMCWSIHEVSPAVPTWLLQEAGARRAVSAASRPTGSYLGNNPAAHYQRALVLPDNCSSTSESFFQRRKNTEIVRPSKQLYINPGTVALAPDEGGSLIFLLNSTALISLLARPSPPHNEAVFEQTNMHSSAHSDCSTAALHPGNPTPSTTDRFFYKLTWQRCISLGLIARLHREEPGVLIWRLGPSLVI